MTDEERAEKYADDTRIIDENTRVGDDCISLVQDFEGNTLDIHERIKRAFLDGFNADRWHYPSKGEYPTDDRRVLVKLPHAENWYECGSYDADYKTWFFESFNWDEDVIAWQYIIPPQETTE